MTVPTEASGDQPTETGPGVTTGPHTPDGGHAIGSKEPHGHLETATSDFRDFGTPRNEQRRANTRTEVPALTVPDIHARLCGPWCRVAVVARSHERPADGARPRWENTGAAVFGPSYR